MPTLNKNNITNRKRHYENNIRSGEIYRRPFWLPAFTYYILSVAISITTFFLVWGIFLEGGEEAPWALAAIFAILIFIGTIIFREVYLRKAQDRFLKAQKQMDYTLSKIPQSVRKNQQRPKFTLQQNASMLKRIGEKSEAAYVLKRLPEGHLDVTEICVDYLNFTYDELHRIDVNSPRFSAIRKGRKLVKKIHKDHLLIWAEIETKKLTLEAKNKSSTEEKISTSQKALLILNSALKFYPKEEKLIASIEALEEFISKVKVSDQIEQAEKSEFKGNFKKAIRLYRDLLFFLTRENLSNKDKDIIAEKVNTEIERLRQLKNKEDSFEFHNDSLKKIEND